MTKFQDLTETVNLLVIPFPFTIDPLNFVSTKPHPKEMSNMDESRFGFFTVRRESVTYRVGEIVKAAIAEAEQRVGKVHIVAMPEAALTHEEYELVKKIADGRGAILMAGVSTPAVDGKRAGENSVFIADPAVSLTDFKQDKHHRWRLDRAQIFQYELGATLNPARDWWEYIAIHDRKQQFLQVDDWLLIAPLICEDLARPDPAGEIVRAVGPDLVIAFLMDGPQLPARWPARYATVLADDPGCSVLTITSLGMALRSQPPEGMAPSWQIGSWKDPVNGLRGICAPTKQPTAVVLTLNKDTRRGASHRQVSADGRANPLTMGFPILSRVQWIELKEGAKEEGMGDDKTGMIRGEGG